MRMLLVEDDFDARMLLQHFVSEYGECDFALDGQEAVDKFLEAQNEGAPYKVIFMDIMLPKMNGREALSFIREWEDQNNVGGLHRVNVIMVSALDDSDNILGSFFENGCEAYITKPYKRRTLISELANLGLIQDPDSN